MLLPKPARRSPKPRSPIVRRRRPRQASIRPRSAAIREADRLFSLLVRAPGRCRRCGLSGQLDCAHVFEKSWASSLRWDLDNALPLCRACHQWGHAHKADFLSMVSFMMGAGAFQALEARARSVTRADVFAEVERLRRLVG